MKEKKLYIGANIVSAIPYSLHEWMVRSQNIQKPTCQDEPGYLVIYSDGWGSWYPKKVFESSYRKINDEEKNLIV